MGTTTSTSKPLYTQPWKPPTNEAVVSNNAQPVVQNVTATSDLEKKTPTMDWNVNDFVAPQQTQTQQLPTPAIDERLISNDLLGERSRVDVTQSYGGMAVSSLMPGQTPFALIEARRAAKEKQAEQVQKEQKPTLLKSTERINQLQRQADYERTLAQAKEIGAMNIPYNEKMATINNMFQAKESLARASNEVETLADNLLKTPNKYISNEVRKLVDEWKSVSGDESLYDYKNPSKGIDRMNDYRRRMQAVMDVDTFLKDAKAGVAQEAYNRSGGYNTKGEKFDLSGTGTFFKLDPITKRPVVKNGLYQIDDNKRDAYLTNRYAQSYPDVYKEYNEDGSIKFIDPMGRAERFNSQTKKMEMFPIAPPLKQVLEAGKEAFKVGTKEDYEKNDTFNVEGANLRSAPYAQWKDAEAMNYKGNIIANVGTFILSDLTGSIEDKRKTGVLVTQSMSKKMTDEDGNPIGDLPAGSFVNLSQAVSLKPSDAKKLGLSDTRIVFGEVQTPQMVKDADGNMVVELDAQNNPIYTSKRIAIPFTEVEGEIAKRYKFKKKAGDAEDWLGKDKTFIYHFGGNRISQKEKIQSSGVNKKTTKTGWDSNLK